MVGKVLSCMYINAMTVPYLDRQHNQYTSIAFSFYQPILCFCWSRSFWYCKYYLLFSLSHSLPHRRMRAWLRQFLFISIYLCDSLRASSKRHTAVQPGQLLILVSSRLKQGCWWIYIQYLGLSALSPCSSPAFFRFSLIHDSIIASWLLIYVGPFLQLHRC